HDLETHGGSELYREVPQPADSEDGHATARGYPGVAHGVERRHSCAAKGRGLEEIEVVRDSRERACWHGDEVCPSTRITHARNHALRAVHHIAAAAELALTAAPSEPADRDPVPNLPTAHPLAKCGNRASNLMA